ncbi:MAG: DUF4369 domain-containing protein [Bacteroidales bacterium]|nr:DUF4369 domain-containing protein [Bacteroidales bacterium]
MKTNRTIIILAIFVAIFFSACDKNSFTISGTLENGADKTIYLEELTPEGTLFIDSIKLDNQGHFKYSYKMPYQSLYNLHTTADNYIILLPDYGEKIDITGDYRNLSMTYNVTGSPQSILLWQLQDYTNDGSRLIIELVDTTNYYKQLQADGLATEAQVKAKKAETDSIYRLAFTAQQDYVCRFIEENPGSLATLIALYKPFNNRPLIAPESNFDYYEFVLDGLQERQPDNPHTIHFKNTVERMRFQLSQQ